MQTVIVKLSELVKTKVCWSAQYWCNTTQKLRRGVNKLPEKELKKIVGVYRKFGDMSMYVVKGVIDKKFGNFGAALFERIIEKRLKKFDLADTRMMVVMLFSCFEEIDFRLGKQLELANKSSYDLKKMLTTLKHKK